MFTKIQTESRLHEAIVGFGRFLRSAGFEIGSGEIIESVKAISLINIDRRDDFKNSLQTIFVRNHKKISLFAQLFDLYWQNPERIEKVSSLLKKLFESKIIEEETEILKRKKAEEKSAQATTRKEEQSAKDKRSNSEGEIDLFIYSPEEILRKKRFDNYTQDDLNDAKEFLKKWIWNFGEKKLRRLKKGKKKYRLNINETIRKNIFPNQDFVKLSWKEQKTKPRPLVLLLDISGSMDVYTKILLHFIFVMNQANRKVEAFTFGTRLNRITHYLRKKDVSTAVNLISDSVNDWSGGTRIGETLSTFNLLWGRRVLGNGAVVIVISDGWDTGDSKKLNREVERLHNSCHRLIWLNPNLGFDEFKPLTEGIQIIIKHIDDFLPVHNINCLVELGKKLYSLNKNKNSKYKVQAA